MKNVARIAVIVGAGALAVAGGGRPAVAEAEHALRGIVEALPDTPDRVGDWQIGGRVVRVEPGTRIEERDGVAPAGYWVQAASGVVVHAPAWNAGDAHQAGFRPAIAGEPGGVSLGRYVEVEGRTVDGVLQATEIEVPRPGPSR